MTFGLLASLFVFILAAVSTAGYVFVLRPSKSESASLDIPLGLSRSQQDLPAAQAAILDTFRALGDSLPLPGNRDAFRSHLIMAGYRWPPAVDIFLGLKAASAIMFGVAAGWAAVFNGVDAPAVALGMVCGLGFGYLIPDRILDRMGAARVGRLRRALPAALDLLVLAIEAGQGLDAAILDTGRGLRSTHPDLAAEFTLLHLELKANASRSDALRNLANRSQDMELRKFSSLLIDTDRFGTSVGPALKTHARYLRIRFRQIAQEKARKVGIKLIFPVFFLIFPSVILVTLGPALILLFSQMKSLMGQ